MPEMFMDRLAAAVAAKQTPLIVGLDPRGDLLPAPLRADKTDVDYQSWAYREFCLGVIEAVAPLVPAVKPQAAFFEQLGWRGMRTLAEVITAAQSQGLLVILDGKRNDIGSTAEGYAEGWLGHESAWGADALTVSPYLGDDSLEPFMETARQRDAGLFVLVKTSNPGGRFLQDVAGDGPPIYRRVGDLLERWSRDTAGNCGYGVAGAVVGATYPEQLAELRAALPHTWFLVPGFGSQGGTAADVAAAFDERGLGAIVNSSRAILFAHRRPEFAHRYSESNWQRAIEEATRGSIAALAAATPAGRLKIC